MASSFDDIARQMAEVGIFVPERHQLHVTAPGYDRFRPDGQRSKKKSAWYRIYENRTLKGRVFYSGSFGIRTESYLIKPGKETFTAEEKAEAKGISPQQFVDEINKYCGNMPGAIGVPEDQLRQAAKSAVCKINIDSDLRLAMTASIRKYLAEHPADFDPRQYLKPARQAIKDMVAHKIVDVLGCDGKAD